jgi:hypothetical protein
MASSPNFWTPLIYHNGLAFRDAALKIKRAESHLVELEHAARELPRKRGQSFLIGPKPDLGQVQLTYLPDPMPLQFACVVGDAVHSIRAAFDYIAVALTAPPIGQGSAKNAYFPTGVNLKAFEAEVSRKMKGAHPDGVKIVRDLEPYHGGKHSLRALHDLDVLDKHKLLIPALAAMHVERLGFTFGDKVGSLGGTDFEAVDDGANFVATVDCPGIQGPEDFRLNDDLRASFDVIFAKGQPLEGQAIVPTLRKLADVAVGVVETCQGLFPNHVMVHW